MAITSTDIQNQGFTISKNGYKVEEVDDFLELVSDEIDILNNRVTDLENKLNDADNAFAGFDAPASASQQTTIITSGANEAALAEKDALIASLQAQLAEAKADGNAIAQVLIVAQRNADEIVANAQAQAGQIVSAAQDKAAVIVQEANEKREQVEQTIDDLEDEREKARSGYQELLKNLIADATEKLSSLSTDDQVVTSAHARRSASTRATASSASVVAAAQSTTTSQTPSQADNSYVSTFTVPANQPVVAAATPSPSAVEKDFSGFGDTDDDFTFDDID